MWDLNDPCFTIYIPPALVEAFPPNWHDPFDPRSKGTWQPYFKRN